LDEWLGGWTDALFFSVTRLHVGKKLVIQKRPRSNFGPTKISASKTQAKIPVFGIAFSAKIKKNQILDFRFWASSEFFSGLGS